MCFGLFLASYSEMYNAMKYGYKFEILRGYTSDKQIIFKNYVESLYAIKSSVDKSNPMYLIYSFYIYFLKK